MVTVCTCQFLLFPIDPRCIPHRLTEHIYVPDTNHYQLTNEQHSQDSYIMWQMRIKTLGDRLNLIIHLILDTFVALGYGVLLWPLSKLAPRRHFWMIRKMSTFLGDQLDFWESASGIEYYEVGEDVSSCYSQNCLVISNHQSSLDPVNLVKAFRLKDVMERTVWISDDWIKYTPLGVCGWLKGDFFVHQGRASEKARLWKHFRNMKTGGANYIIVLFPEGGFLRKRRLKSQMYAKEHNLPVFQNVCLPRTGAFETILSALDNSRTAPENTAPNGDKGIGVSSKRTSLQWIVDITIGYKPNTSLPSFETLGMFVGTPSTIFLHHRMFPIKEVPTDSEGLKNWLYQRYEEKEELLTVFHETGAFPERLHTRNQLVNPPRPIKCGIWQSIFAYLFLVASLIFQYWVVMWLGYIITVMLSSPVSIKR